MIIGNRIGITIGGTLKAACTKEQINKHTTSSIPQIKQTNKLHSLAPKRIAEQPQFTPTPLAPTIHKGPPSERGVIPPKTKTNTTHEMNVVILRL